MATKLESYNHGLHNMGACELLALNQTFPDWVITTAFYACLQFVTAKIFPYTHVINSSKSVQFKTIEQYQTFKNYTSNKRHELLSDLVTKCCTTDNIDDDYEWLLSASMSARYHNYQQDKLVAQRAKSIMKKIQKYCDPEKK